MFDFKNGYEDINVVDNLMEWLNYLKKNNILLYKRAKAYSSNLDN